MLFVFKSVNLEFFYGKNIFVYWVIILKLKEICIYLLFVVFMS